MIFLFFFLSFSAINWLDFQTEKNLFSACSICKLQISKMRKNQTFSKPLPDSPCDKKNNENKFCSLIQSIQNDVDESYISKNLKIPNNYCSIKGPCIFSSPKTLRGVDCPNCLNVMTFVFYANISERNQVFKNFCSSVFSSTLDFCKIATRLINRSMKNDFLNSLNSTNFCVKSGFCYSKGNKSSHYMLDYDEDFYYYYSDEL